MNGRVSVGTSGLILKVIVPAAVALLLLIVAYFAARLIARWVAAVVCQHRSTRRWGNYGRLTFYSLMIMVGLTVLQTANVDVTSFAAVIAAGPALQLALPSKARLAILLQGFSCLFFALSKWVT